MTHRSFSSLSEREILALAISLEEQDSRIYGDFADGLEAAYPSTAKLFRDMQRIEKMHRHRLFEQYRVKFGEELPAIIREDVKGFVKRNPIWLLRPLRLEAARRQAAVMELETQRFYERAAAKSTDVGIRKLLGDLAEEEAGHVHAAEAIEERVVGEDKKSEEAQAQKRLFVLQVVQPGLAGLMDGSVSTLAPLFAAAFATHNTFDAFLVGIAASVGAGISMGFAESLSDDGSLTGRGKPLLRGCVCGLMTAVGGLGHTMPYLIPNFSIATGVAITVVIIELAVISWIRHRFMDSPWFAAMIQVMLGGLLVFLAGVFIGGF